MLRRRHYNLRHSPIACLQFLGSRQRASSVTDAHVLSLRPPVPKPQIHIVHQWSFIQRNSLLFRHHVQRPVNRWQVLQRQITDERALDLVIPDSPVHPPQKHHKLCAQRQHSQHNCHWRRRHFLHLICFGLRRLTANRLPIAYRLAVVHQLSSGFLHEQRRDTTERSAQARSQRTEKPARPRGIRSHTQQLGRDSQCLPQ